MPEILIKSEGAANDGDVLGARDEWTQEQQEALASSGVGLSRKIKLAPKSS